MTKPKPFALILMPFTKAAPLKRGYIKMDQEALDTVYNLFEAALTKLGYRVARAQSESDILRDLILDLDRADLVVADLTSLNPNVMYELGIRHGFCKKTVIVTQDLDELPFDVAGTFCIEYGWVKSREKTEFERKLKEVLELIEAKEDPRFGPVHTHLGSKELGIRDRDHEIVLQRLQALFLELLQTYAVIGQLRSELRSQFPADFPADEHETIKRFDQVSEGLSLAASRVMWPARGFPAADLLLSNAYIPTDYDASGEISQFTFHLRMLADRSMELSRSPTLALIEWVYSHSGALLNRTVQISAAVRHRRKGQPLDSETDKEMVDKESERLAGVAKQISELTRQLSAPRADLPPSAEAGAGGSTP